jgi:threonyl-tRNA synthetase
MNAKIRNHTKMKVPFILVVGDKEMEAGMVAPRARDSEGLEPMSVDKFIELVRK